MNISTLLWSFLQVSLLSAFAIGVSLLVTRRYPKISVAATSTAAIVILLTTLLLFVPIPRWQLPASWTQLNENAHTKTQQLKSQSNVEKERLGSRSWLSFGLNDLTALHLNKSVEQKSHFVALLTQSIVLACVILGSCRLIVSCFFLRKTLHSIAVIQNTEVTQLVDRISQRMGCQRTVTLCVSGGMISPTVIGWLRPRIVLPSDWERWSPQQLQAALAHELAHIVRGDLPWRILAAITQVVHYYHPLAHWLWHRLTFSQEVAADQLAVSAIGNRKSYYRALSELAIRQDDQSRRHVAPILLPTLSSHLIRRIKMLRTTECRTSGRGQKLARLGVIALVAMLGTGTIALRGLAHSSPNTKAALAENELFTHTPIMPLVDPENDQGIYLIKVSKLTEHDSIKPLVPLINRTAAVAWQDNFALDEMPDFDINSIDYITGLSLFEVQRLGEDSPHEHKNSIQFGAKYGLIRFKQEILDWKEWVRKNLPQAEETQIEECTYFKLQIPAIGPEPCCITIYDDRTIIVSGGEELLLTLVETEFQNHSAHWEYQWNSLDTGLISFISADYKITPSMFESDDVEIRDIDQIFDNIIQIGYGLDIESQTGNIGFKVQMDCLDKQKMELVTSAIRSLTERTLKQANKLLPTFDAKGDGPADHQEKKNEKYSSKEDCEQAIALFSNYSTRISANPDNTWTIDITAPSPWTIKDLIGDMLTAKELASKQTAGSNK